MSAGNATKIDTAAQMPTHATPVDSNNWLSPPLSLLENAMRHSLETCANVHRGTGHASMTVTHLYETARKAVLLRLGLSGKKYTVIFCPPERAKRFTRQLPEGSYHTLKSTDIGLNLGVTAIAVLHRALPNGKPGETGGGTTRLIGDNWAIWAGVPDRFEPGTPAIVNTIAFAAMLGAAPLNVSQLHRRTPSISARDIMDDDTFGDKRGDALIDALRQTRIGRQTLVPTTKGNRPYIHLDHSAGTPTFDAVYHVFKTALLQPAPMQAALVKETRRIVARIFGAPEDRYQICFTSGTTEAVYLAARHLRETIANNISPVVVSTTLEHSSNDLPWRDIPGCRVIHLSVDDEGFMDTKQLGNLLAEYNAQKKHKNQRIVLVTASGASNVLGTCNDLSSISVITHKFGAKLFVDAAQLAAHRSVSMDTVNIDYLAFSGHKVYAPFGSGALITRKQPAENATTLSRMSAADDAENAAGIAALGKALQLLARIGFDIIAQKEQSLVRYALTALQRIDGIRLYGITDADSPRFSERVGVIPFDIKNAMPAATAKNLMLRGGIGVRYGCHCAHMIVKQVLHIGPRLQIFQRVLQQMIPPLKFQGVVRISFGLENTCADVDAVVAVLRETVQRQIPETPDVDAIKTAKQKTRAFIHEREKLVFPELQPR